MQFEKLAGFSLRTCADLMVTIASPGSQRRAQFAEFGVRALYSRPVVLVAEVLTVPPLPLLSSTALEVVLRKHRMKAPVSALAPVQLKEGLVSLAPAIFPKTSYCPLKRLMKLV